MVEKEKLKKKKNVNHRTYMYGYKNALNMLVRT